MSVGRARPFAPASGEALGFLRHLNLLTRPEPILEPNKTQLDANNTLFARAVWEKDLHFTSYRPQAAGYKPLSKIPTPVLPKGEEAL